MVVLANPCDVRFARAIVRIQERGLIDFFTELPQLANLRTHVRQQNNGYLITTGDAA